MSELLVQTERVTVAYGGLTALKNVDFALEQGRIVGLIGPNGAGKSTFFNVLTGFTTPTTGKVIFRQVPVTGKKPHVFNKLGIGRTFQTLRLLQESSALENVLLGYHQISERNLFRVLFRTGKFVRTEKQLRDKALAKLEFVGLGGQADSPVSVLSYSQRRRLEIARALATEPQVLLLDEPTAGMNPAETAKAMDLVLRIRQALQVSIVIIEHDMKVVMGLAEKVMVLDHGEKIAEGSPEEIRRNSKVIEAYLGSGYAHAQS